MQAIKDFFLSSAFKKGMIAFLIGFLLFLIAGDLYFSKVNVINRYVHARQKADVAMEDLKPYLVWADTKNYVTFDEAKYARFNPLSADQAQSLKKELYEATEEDQLFITSIGKRFWFFSDYRIAMKPLSLTVKANVPQMDLLLNQKKVAVTDSEDFTYTIERLPIADYEASLSGNYQDKRLQFSKTYDGQNPLIDLTVTFKSFEVLSNSDEGEVMVGQNRVGSLKKGHYTFDRFPMTSDLPVFIQKNFADGEVKSNQVQLSAIEEGASIRLDMPNLLDEETAGRLLVSAFEQFASYLVTKQEPTDLSLFESGATNGFYRALKDSVQKRLLTDARRASSVSIPNIWVNSLRQVGKESYALDYSAVYAYYYDKATDPAKKTQGTLSQTISGVATLKKMGDSYIFQSTGNSGVQVVKEEDKVKPVTIFPEGVLGSWEGVARKEKVKVSQAFTEEGKISVTLDYEDPAQEDKHYTASVEEVVEVGSGVYRYVGVSGDIQALTLGLGGLGGAGVSYDYGFQLTGNSLKPVIWQAGQGADFDYSKALGGLVLKKK